ncbi:MAG TPA: methyltransferase [Gemmatimonadaceae bacterium]|nr:methyltransferase [Gemmatimonadaceae bacterium]
MSPLHRTVTTLPSFIDEAHRLRAFTPPFAFSAFFSPEDTLLCVCASEEALDQMDVEEPRIAELTTGSGLVGLRMLQVNESARLAALDVDTTAVSVATTNAVRLGLSDRARFTRADIWSNSTLNTLRAFNPDLLICNPPYVPEPQEQILQIEAGAGLDGTAHLERTLEIASDITPEILALSWCSLSDPAKIIRLASRAGYALDSLLIVVIADGEYSGSVHDYLRTLPHAYINEQRETLDALATDGSVRFAYLLMAGVFTKSDDRDDHTDLVQQICERFSSEGLISLASVQAAIPVRAWLLNRRDELELRVILHGK